MGVACSRLWAPAWRAIGGAQVSISSKWKGEGKRKSREDEVVETKSILQIDYFWGKKYSCQNHRPTWPTVSKKTLAQLEG